MNRRVLLAATSLLPVAGCAAFSADITNAVTTVGKVTATVTADITSVVNQYELLKGVAGVALAALSIANPAAAAVVNSVLAVAEPVLTRLTTATGAAASTASADVATLLTSSTQLATALKGTFTATANAVSVIQNS